MAQEGDNRAMDYIVAAYTPFVKRRTGPYFLAGADKEDLEQEGLIGLYKAVKTFDGAKGAAFKTFAELCIVRQMISAVKTASRKKNHPLNHYVSIHGTGLENASEERSADVIEDPNNLNPERIFIEREQAKGMESEIAAVLSEFELDVLTLYLRGISYQKIAACLKKEPKAVDNALQRIRKKIEKLSDADV